MSTSTSRPAESDEGGPEGAGTAGNARKSGRGRRPKLRLVGGRDVEERDRAREQARRDGVRARQQERRRAQRASEEGTTTAEYTVVTGAAVAFGALLFKLLTSEWGNKILTTAFRHVISLLGF